MPLEVLHLALVLLGGGAGGEGAEVAALAGLGILLAGIETELAGMEPSGSPLWPSASILPVSFSTYVEGCSKHAGKMILSLAKEWD